MENSCGHGENASVTSQTVEKVSSQLNDADERFHRRLALCEETNEGLATGAIAIAGSTSIVRHWSRTYFHWPTLETVLALHNPVITSSRIFIA